MLNITQPWGCRVGRPGGDVQRARAAQSWPQAVSVVNHIALGAPPLQECEGLKEQGKCRTSVWPRTLLFISTLDDSPGCPDFDVSFVTGEVVKCGKLFVKHYRKL